MRQALREWVQHAAGEGTSAVDDATPLISSGLITSMQAMDLLLLIGELRQQSVDPTSLRPGAFQDINTIYATFFASDSPGFSTDVAP